MLPPLCQKALTFGKEMRRLCDDEAEEADGPVRQELQERNTIKTEDLLKEIESLPVEERLRIADSVLKTLNPPESEIDKKWGEVAKRRLEDVRSGNVQPVPGKDVFDEIWKRFS